MALTVCLHGHARVHEFAQFGPEGKNRERIALGLNSTQLRSMLVKAPCQRKIKPLFPRRPKARSLMRFFTSRVNPQSNSSQSGLRRYSESAHIYCVKTVDISGPSNPGLRRGWTTMFRMTLLGLFVGCCSGRRRNLVKQSLLGEIS
jgi:hypothetical protein